MLFFGIYIKVKEGIRNSGIANPDGNSGIAYMQLIKDLIPNTYDNKQTLPVSYSVTPIIRGNNVYILPGWEESNMLKLYEVSDGEIKMKTQTELPAKAGVHTLETVGDKLYVPYSLMGKISVLNKDTLKIEKETDISSYGIGDQNPDASQMLERDGILYVGLNQIKGNEFMPDPTRNKINILLIDTKTDTVIKMITEENTKM